MNNHTGDGKLSKKKEKRKSKEKRLEEKEKVDAEIQRSLAVAKMKEAHKAIEDIEKLRKRSALRSVCQRIEDCIKEISTRLPMLLKPPFGSNPVYDEDLRKRILFHGQIYESIRYDFQKTLNINDQEMEKLFPEIEMIEKSGFSIGECFSNMISQLKQMRIYCERYFE